MGLPLLVGVVAAGVFVAGVGVSVAGADDVSVDAGVACVGGIPGVVAAGVFVVGVS